MRSARDLASLAEEGSLFAATAMEKLERLQAELQPLSERYDVVVANPPYMGSSSLGKWMGAWAKKHYLEAYRDLCTSFIDRGFTLSNDQGYSAMVTMQSWMFLGSYEKLRDMILHSHSISSMAHLGTRAFGAIGGEVVSTTATVFANAKYEARGSYFRLVDMGSEEEKQAGLLEALANPDCGWFYRCESYQFQHAPGCPLAYWMNKSFFDSFGAGVSIDDLSNFTGSQNITGDNNKYLRFRWEVNIATVGPQGGWVPYAKGGDYRRWYGNIDLVVDWSESGKLFYKKNSTSNLLSNEYWFKEGITYNAITSGKPHFRYMPNGCIFDKGGPSIIELGDRLPIVLAYLNSTTCEHYLDAMNPTLNLQVKDIKSLPLLIDEMNVDEITSIALECIALSRTDWNQQETSEGFVRHPLI